MSTQAWKTRKILTAVCLIACLAGAVVLAALQVEGWGWLIFIALLLAADL